MFTNLKKGEIVNLYEAGEDMKQEERRDNRFNNVKEDVKKLKHLG